MRLRCWSWAVAASLTLAGSSPLLAQQRSGKDRTSPKDAEARRPKLMLKGQPLIGMSPSRVVLTAELVGGANDFEEYYCPTVAWEWGDGTVSESTFDCQPYEAGKTAIRRRFTVDHVFRAGEYEVAFRLKRHDKAVATATIKIQVQSSIRDH